LTFDSLQWVFCRSTALLSFVECFVLIVVNLANVHNMGIAEIELLSFPEGWQLENPLPHKGSES
jgi:hypothetical protein